MIATTSRETFIEDWVCTLVLLASILVVLLVTVDMTKVDPSFAYTPECTAHCR